MNPLAPVAVAATKPRTLSVVQPFVDAGPPSDFPALLEFHLLVALDGFEFFAHRGLSNARLADLVARADLMQTDMLANKGQGAFVRSIYSIRAAQMQVDK